MWYPRLLRTALRMTDSRGDAHDLTQQALCKALGSWGTFTGQSSPLTWVHTILVNCIRDYHRRRRLRRTEPLDEWALPARNVLSEPVVQDVQQREVMARLQQAIDELSWPLRQAFVATLVDGYSYQDAAELLGVPVGTICSRVRRARDQLMVATRGLYEEPDQ